MAGITAADLFARHHHDVYRYLIRMSGRRDVADDLLQDVTAGANTTKVGETGTASFYTSSDFAAGGMAAGRPVNVPDLASKYRYLWQVDTRLVSVGTDVVTFEIDWKRSEMSNGAAQVVAGDRRTVTLGQGDHHVLDFVPSTASDSAVANVVLEVTASPVEDPTYANVTLGYDLWLIY